MERAHERGVLGAGHNDGAVLVTSAVEGVPADQIDLPDLRRAWPGISRAVRALHELPVAGCPFARDIDTMMGRARDVIGRGAVNPDFLPDHDRSIPGVELMDR